MTGERQLVGELMYSNLLKDKGVSARDEKKIVAMRDFIVKQAQASRA